MELTNEFKLLIERNLKEYERNVQINYHGNAMKLSSSRRNSLNKLSMKPSNKFQKNFRRRQLIKSYSYKLSKEIGDSFRNSFGNFFENSFRSSFEIS